MGEPPFPSRAGQWSVKWTLSLHGQDWQGRLIVIVVEREKAAFVWCTRLWLGRLLEMRILLKLGTNRVQHALRMGERAVVYRKPTRFSALFLLSTSTIIVRKLLENHV